jgi:hypothetical protein
MRGWGFVSSLSLTIAWCAVPIAGAGCGKVWIDPAPDDCGSFPDPDPEPDSGRTMRDSGMRDSGTKSDGAKSTGDDGAAPEDPPSFPEDITPLPHACGADRAPCVDSGCTSTCLAATHVPNHFGDYVMAQTLKSIDISGSAIASTSDGRIGGIRAANADPTVFEVRSGIGFVRRKQSTTTIELGVWTFAALRVRGGTLRIEGDASALLASRTDVTIEADGVIDVGARGRTPGPGGFAGGTFVQAGGGCGGGGVPGGSGTSGDGGQAHGGGGGGGFGTAGGPGGGSSFYGEQPGDGGQACVSFPFDLVGGSGGAGADTSGFVPGPFGGGGGGALQITALTALSLAGVLTSGGGGGRTAEGNSRHGAGGGSGGMIVLEAPRIPRLARVYTNGGGGGSASAGTGSSCSGGEAEDGSPRIAPARGSRCARGVGGDGATWNESGGAGESYLMNAGGGGGGGTGIVYIHQPTGSNDGVEFDELSGIPARAHDW